ncbi:Uncharacterised protein [uncultured archaeon]|nr:Uncharacterised protein [uncultured archaeon]
MRQKRLKSLAVVLLLFIAIGCIEKSGNPVVAETTPKVTDIQPVSTADQLPSACTNPEPLKHVYNPKRLAVLDPCKTVSGTVVKIIRENDGDTHIRLKVDPQYADTINQVNVDKQGGNLVVEIVCAFEITQADAINACSGYENKIPLPEVNEHVVITGQFVSDTEHGGWNEIHPVYGISVK